MAFPKSGSTWMRFVLANVLTGRPMDFDLVRVASPPLGMHRGALATLPRGGRLIKSHELPRFVSRARPKIIYLVRDGRDVAVSFHKHLQRRGMPVGELDAFVRQLAAGKVDVYGSWQGHVEAWRHAMAASSEPSATIRYEDLLTEPVDTLLQAGDRLGLALPEATVRAALVANEPDAMRAKESSSAFLATTKRRQTPFVGNARAGSWPTALSPTAIAAFERVAGGQLQACGYRLASH